MSNTVFRFHPLCLGLPIILVLAMIGASAVGYAQNSGGRSDSRPEQLVSPSADAQLAGDVDPNRAAQLIEQLPSFEARQKAMFELWKDYANSRSVVEKLATSSDPEVARRARWILSRWEIGLLPDLPRAVRRRLEGFEGNPDAAVQTLLDAGCIREAVEVAKHAMLTGGNEESRILIAEVISRRFVQLVHEARLAGQLDRFIDLLDMASETRHLAVARAVLLHRLNTKLDEANILPVCASNWSMAQRIEVAAICWSVIGEFDRAIEVAKKSATPELLVAIYILDNRWEELAEVSFASIEDDLPATATIDQHAMWLVAADQAGLTDQIRDSSNRIMIDEDVDELHWRSLALAGQFDSAVEVAKRVDKNAAAELLQTQLRFDEAFALFGVDPAYPKPAIDRMLRRITTKKSSAEEPFEMIEGQAIANEMVGDPVEDLLTVVRLLHSVGIKHYTKPTLLSIAAIKISTDPDDLESEQEQALRSAMFAALRLGLDDFIPELLAILGPPQSLASVDYYGFVLANGSPTFFGNLIRGLAAMDPKAEPVDIWRQALEILDGKVPAGWNKSTDLERLYEMIAQSTMDNDLLVRRSRIWSPPNYLNGDLFAGLGRPDLAAKAYAEAIQLRDPVAILRFADHELLAGNSETAVEFYDSAIDLTSRGLATFQGVRTEPFRAAPASAASAMVGKAIALRRLGRSDEAERIEQTLDLVMFQPANDTGRDYIQRLETLGQTERQRQVTPYELRYATFNRTVDLNLYSMAIAYSTLVKESDPAEAARWARIAVIATMKRASLYPAGYATLTSLWYTLDAVAAAGIGDRTAAEKALDKSLVRYPMNITMAEEQLGKFRDANMTDLADRILDRIFDFGLAYVGKYPGDANALNNLAWSAAINGQHYEKALELSTLAVFLEPDSVSYRDTLAEILFRMGDSEQAIAVERQCLLDDPAHWHLHEQIERFSQP